MIPFNSNRQRAAACLAFCSLLSLSACTHSWFGRKEPSTGSEFFASGGQHANGDNTRYGQHVFRVALDIGHTPKAPGAVGADGTVEYAFNKNMVTLLAADLKLHPGISVVVINSHGDEMSLAERSAVANRAGVDLFLSVHHDSVNDKYLVPREVGGRTFFQTDKFHGYSVFFSGKNPQESASLTFARSIGAAMRDQGFTPTRHHAEKIQGENRDLVIPKLAVYRFDDLVVLKESHMPAALLECGVIVNPKEEALLKQPDHQARIVTAVTTAVLSMAKSTTDQAETLEGNDAPVNRR